MYTDKKEYSFSTCWNIKRHTTGEGMIEEILSLGFRQVELNYNVTDELLKTIEPMIERGQVGVSSVHNTFPHVADPDYGTDSVLLGFDDEPRRKRAIELLLRSAEYAHRYGAKAVVVHPGEVPFEYNIDEALKKIYHEQGKDSPAYQDLWQEMLEKRQAGSEHYLKRIQESLEEVCNLSEQRGYGVNFGIETRSRCYQMPTLQEAGSIIGQMKGAPLGLWYDIGHGMMMDRMGLYDNVREANALIDHVVGVHIHETVGLSDHWCPYIHSQDMTYFDSFLDIIDRSPVKVYELKAACTPEEIDESHKLITARIAERREKKKQASEV